MQDALPSTFLGYFWTTAAQAFAAEIDAMGIVYETVEDGVGIGGSPMISCHFSTGVTLHLMTRR
jgi:ABC-type uncharacterized transport system substrate-binding protein